MTFDRLEPRLGGLAADTERVARDGRGDGGYCPARCYTRHFSWRIPWIVGRFRKSGGDDSATEAVLRSPAAFDLVSAHIRGFGVATREHRRLPERLASTAGPAPDQPLAPREPLSESETRVLRYLPTHLTTPEIANELFLSVNTVSTHTRHLYAKLGVHSRREAVDRARGLGLLAPSALRT